MFIRIGDDNKILNNKFIIVNLKKYTNFKEWSCGSVIKFMTNNSYTSNPVSNYSCT